MKFRAGVVLTLLIGMTGCSVVGSHGRDEARSRVLAFEQAVDATSAGEYQSGQRLMATVAAICPMDDLGRRATLLLAASELDPRNPDARPDVAARLAALQLLRPGPDWARSLAGSMYLHALDLGAAPVDADADHLRVLWSAYQLEGARADGAGVPVPVRAAEPAEADEPAQASGAEPAAEPAAEVVSPVRGPTQLQGCSVPAPDRRFTLPELPREALATRVARLQTGGTPPPQPSGQAAGDVAALQAEVQRLRSQLEEKEQELARIRRTLRP